MKELNKVHSDEKSLVGNCLSFQKITGICSRLTGTYFKTQSKLTNFLNQRFKNTKYLEIYNIPGAVELLYILYGLNCVIE